MTRLSVALVLVAWTMISPGIASSQQGGTVSGKISDTTEAQLPIEGVRIVILAQDGTEFTTITDANGDYEKSGIPAGRYLISIYKEGYHDRLGKPVTVVDGGDHYVPLKMTKKNTLMDFFLSPVPMFWALILCVIIVLLLLILVRTNR